MTINAKTGEPITTAMMEEGLDVYVIATDKKNLKTVSDYVCSGAFEGNRKCDQKRSDRLS